MNSTIVGKHILNIKCVFRLSLQLLSEKLLILRIKRDVIIRVRKSSWGIRYYCQILIKPELSRQSFEKSSNTKFHDNPSSGSRDVHADRHSLRH